MYWAYTSSRLLIFTSWDSGTQNHYHKYSHHHRNSWNKNHDPHLQNSTLVHLTAQWVSFLKWPDGARSSPPRIIIKDSDPSASGKLIHDTGFLSCCKPISIKLFQVCFNNQQTVVSSLLNLILISLFHYPGISSCLSSVGIAIFFLRTLAATKTDLVMERSPSWDSQGTTSHSME